MGEGCRLGSVAKLSIWYVGALVNFFPGWVFLIKVTIDLTDMAETDPKPKCKKKPQGGNICAAVGCGNTIYNSSISLFRFPKEKER